MLLTKFKNFMCKKILVADDDPAIVDSIKIMLELEGYDVETTVNGETIYKMEKEFPDLLLLDIWMSGQDGRDICRYLKKNDSTKNIPVIMVSASLDIMKSAKAAGADGFLAKPFEMEDLLAAIRQYTK
jgi:CheY-like chemotaxis protein